jgi:hypothetical protein
LGGLAAALLLIAAADAGQHAFEIVHEGFDAFSRGEFDHSGANLYVSRKGRVQLINRWDLNSDGFHDFVFSNTHNVMVGSIDALGYLQTERGFRSVISPVHDSLARYDRWLRAEKKLATTVRLPSERPTAVLFHDVGRDGDADLLVASAGSGDADDYPSFLYWGTAAGYRRDLRLELPTVAASDVAAGDLDGDGYEEIVFANAGSPNPTSAQVLTSIGVAETPHGSKVRFQVRSSANQAGLRQAPWLDLETGGKFHCERWLQYRAVLIAGRGHFSLASTKVVVRSSEKHGDTAGSDAESIH